MPEPKLERREPEEIIPETAEQPQAEMPEDFEDPEGKQGKWKTVKGEVEIEGKKVEVSYREKVIDLPKHRQQETGIKRIRRRELLPPFPEGLYLSSDRIRKRKLEAHEKELRYWISKGQARPGLNLEQELLKDEKRLENTPFMPAYCCEEKFDKFFNFLTDNKVPSPDIYAHSMLQASGHPERELLKRFKRKGSYFQQIGDVDDKEGGDTYRYGKMLYLWRGKIYGHEGTFNTPVFIFSGQNKSLSTRLLRHDGPWEEEYQLWPNFSPDAKQAEPIKWCNADLAIIPTKRSLNVLFFETGAEDKREKE